MTQRPRQASLRKQESRAYFKALGGHISLLRKQRGMTQAELARALGVSQQAVFAYELAPDGAIRVQRTLDEFIASIVNGTAAQPLQPMPTCWKRS